ncbi:MAG TPA: nucleotidyltransferase domain-containing protein [Candidatus Polarisedimenticolaceae bacterium]|nr:nucleotidyltransferase domain-containing protein [Candidatus Polarisedimenticolaceae bacterium]
MAHTGDVEVFRAEAAHSLEELARLARAPLESAGAERAVVFGTYARGEADGYSDLDLVVVLRTDRPFLERWKQLRGVLDALPLPVDLLVYTPEEYRRGITEGRGIFAAIAEEGVTLYARS